ncbi:hypothetical protein C8Q76DRAFT_240107 [Earliella scabrosa]|nr:hypothetical protein C8Q76DRAFT_240107 [Earliella scabrosa]
MSIFYDLVSENELDEAIKIELQGYPEDEAASLESFRYRQSRVPELFLGAYLPGPNGSGRTLIGYVCSTLSSDTTLTHASMSTHVRGGATVCIHSVCVSPEHRRKHVGLGLVKEYVSRIARAGKHAHVLLIAHAELRGFYEQAGFEWVGPSAVVHGARPWFEMRLELSAPGTSAASRTLSEIQDPASAPAQTQTISVAGTTDADHGQAIPPGLWEALQRSSTRTRPTARLLTSFPGAAADVIDAPPTSGESPTNKYDLLCPRLGCGSVILMRSGACLVERASVQLEPAKSTAGLPSCLGPLPAPPATAQWWLVTGSAMAFENIGFSRPVQGLSGRREERG